MSPLDKEFFLVRQVGTQNYEMGSGLYSVPKLYSKGSANSLRTKRNKEVLRTHEARCRRADHDLKPQPEDVGPYYEIVPVTLTLGDPQ